ncbi:MAG: DUF4280 domain-containing protein [Bacteroidales bacterium]|nr:DUF4280 domain-containing protein [Bacteroidales bacterium]
MGKFVCAGAVLQCSFGMAPSTFMVPDPTRPLVQNKPMANISDMKPMANIMPFGMCQSMSNPTVASATAAAMGTLTPMPCVPVIVAPWVPGGKEMVANMPALLDNCKCMCAWGGNISVNMPGNVCLAEGK